MSHMYSNEGLLFPCDEGRTLNFADSIPIITRAPSETPYFPEVVLSHLQAQEAVKISIVVAGHGIYCTPHRTTACGTGDMFITNAGVPHAFCSTQDGEIPEICSLSFKPSTLFGGEIGDPDSAKYCFGVFQEDALSVYVMLTATTLLEVEHILTRIENELVRRKPHWKEAICGYLTNLLIMAGRYASERAERGSGVRHKDQLLVLSAIRTILEKYADADLTLESIARNLYVNQASLCRAFRKVAGETFSGYLRRVRLEQACRLLRETDMTCEDIVFACGIRDLSHFFRLFKQHTGMTPRAYRLGTESAETSKNKKLIIQKGKSIMSIAILNEISENLQKGKAKIVKELVQKAIDDGIDPDTILNEGLLDGMNIIGEKFKNNEVYVPEVLVSARAMNMGSQVLKPYLAAAGVQAKGKVCIGTVQGDLHDIGKNLVKMMLEGKGLEVIDLGTDVPAEVFVKTAVEQNCKVICCSALLTTTMGVMEDVVKKAEELGVRDQVKIMVGGAPINEDFCKKIGADIYTPDAASAADAAAKFCKE